MIYRIERRNISSEKLTFIGPTVQVADCKQQFLPCAQFAEPVRPPYVSVGPSHIIEWVGAFFAEQDSYSLSQIGAVERATQTVQRRDVRSLDLV